VFIVKWAAAIILAGYVLAALVPWRILLGLTILVVLAWLVWESYA
jgi:hypothetical protein